MGVELGRVSQEGLIITLKPKIVPSMVIGISQGHHENVTSDPATSLFYRNTITLGAGLCPVCEGRSTQFFHRPKAENWLGPEGQTFAAFIII